MMEFKLATMENIESITKFHCDAFSDYYLAQLGKNLVRKYYSYFISNSEDFCIIAVESNQVIGIALFVKNYDEKFSIFYRKESIEIMKAITLQIIKLNKFILKDSFDKLKKVLFSDNTEKYIKPEYSMLSLAVSKNYRNMGIASNLILNGEKILLENNFNKYYLAVKKGNDNAIKFYNKHEFYSTIESDKLIFMEKVLDEQNKN